MNLGFHAGKCCGIKVIWEFNRFPDEEVPALPKIAINDSDILYRTVSSLDRFFHEAAPQETRIERLDRYIAYLRERRPQHIIEVVLAESNESSLCQRVWFPIVEARGFKRVTSAKNSNSGNICHIYHLIINED